MNRLKEIAKFVCGAEAFHTFTHTYFWLSGTTVHVFGFAETPTVHLWSAVINGLICVLLGMYGWNVRLR